MTRQRRKKEDQIQAHRNVMNEETIKTMIAERYGFEYQQQNKNNNQKNIAQRLFSSIKSLLNM